jgi:hypothetical protein
MQSMKHAASRPKPPFPSKVLNGEIVDPLPLFRFSAAGRIQPAVNDLIPRRQGDRHKPIVIRRTRRVFSDRIS